MQYHKHHEYSAVKSLFEVKGCDGLTQLEVEAVNLGLR